MHQDRQIKTANWLRNIARYSLLTIGILIFVFALLSGSEDYGGVLKGIIKYSPNAGPWLLLLIFVFVAWKWELAGGILITLLGLFVTWFMSFRGNNFFILPFIFFLLIILMGLFFLISWYLRRKNVS